MKIDMLNPNDLVREINHRYVLFSDHTDDGLREFVGRIEKRIAEGEDPNKYLADIYAIVKETARRFSQGDIIVRANENDVRLSRETDFVTIEGSKARYHCDWEVRGNKERWGMIHYDEQILCGILLHQGRAVEMATGEGKTLATIMPTFLNALTHNGVHVMTVNDYLSKRDFELTRPLYSLYGLSVDCIENIGDIHSTDERPAKQRAYNADITFGSNQTFIFDYLYDHLAEKQEDCVQRNHYYAIIDELDSILIDEASTPHIIGGKPITPVTLYKKYASVVAELVSDKSGNLYNADKNKKNARLTETGENWIAEKTKIEYNNPRFKDDIHVIQQLLYAYTIYDKDVDYIVENGKISIIDPYTGRVRQRSRWEHGLHTAIEVKEDVPVQIDNLVLAIISKKNYLRLYDKRAGMSGTIAQVADELLETYELASEILPTHRPVIRQDKGMRIFRTKSEKYQAIVDEIKALHALHRPILVGVKTIKKAGEICALLNQAGITYRKLDATTLDEEAYIISQAGLSNAITVATSVAGRGTDIKLSPAALAAGGLAIISAGLFGSSRVDCQLKGRAGRQGDPGSSQFFVSLEDSILNYLSGEQSEALRKIAERKIGTDLTCPEIAAFFELAQKNQESSDKERRQKYDRKDDKIDPRRSFFYEERNAVLKNPDKVNKIVDRILVDPGIINGMQEHLKSLYKTAACIAEQSNANNPDLKEIAMPFASTGDLFTITFSTESLRDLFYFEQAFKRAVILMEYDKQWQPFVQYLSEDLDDEAIEGLDGKFDDMMQNVGTNIRQRLLYSSIPVRTPEPTERFQEREIRSNPGITAVTRPGNDSPCPCGSGKKFGDCHGAGIPQKRTNRRR